jgi:hypothetical protein
LDTVRTRLLDALRKQPGDTHLLLRGAETISRMTAAEHRLSRRQRRKVAENYAKIIQEFNEQLWPDDPGRHRGPVPPDS